MKAEKIREWRLAAGLTQQDVADRLRVTKAAVTWWEKGRAQNGPAALLLDMLINNRHPFHSPEEAEEARWNVSITMEEWDSLQVQRLRCGFGFMGDYICWLIRRHIGGGGNEA